MKSKVVILTEAGTRFGYGHLVRCLAIAQGFKERNIDSSFYLRGDSSPEEILDGFQWENLDWLERAPDVAGKIVILDSYYSDVKFCKNIYFRAGEVLFIDDYNRIPYPGGFVLNSVIGAKETDYLCNNQVTCLFGPDYHPLRKEFWNVPDKVVNQVVKKVLITFGGSDTTNETPNVLKTLIALHPELEKHVVIGRGFLNIGEIKKVADQSTLLIYYPDAEKMKQLMMECDIAISAAGQTIYELARVGVPTFAVKVVDNQDAMIKRLKEINFLIGLENIAMIPDYNIRICFRKLGRSIVDGKGVQRIVESIAKIPDYNIRIFISKLGRSIVYGKGVQRIVELFTDD